MALAGHCPECGAPSKFARWLKKEGKAGKQPHTYESRAVRRDFCRWVQPFAE
jgi:hypothetical protein